MKLINLSTLKDISLQTTGLSSEEVLSQRSRYGKNQIIDTSTNLWWDVLKDSLKDPMVLFLFVLGVIFIFLHDYKEGITLLLAVIPLLLMDVFLHWRARSASQLLTEDLLGSVKVIRHNLEQTIPTQELVPGDIVKISPGEVIPADGILELANDIKIDESALTGESFPNVKIAHTIHFPSAIAKQTLNIKDQEFVSAGTRVLTGFGILRVVATGEYTIYGEIIRSVTQVKHEQTPLQIHISKLVKYLMGGALFFCLFLALIRILQGHGWIDALLSSATLAIAAIPEEFPMVFTFFLGLGVYRLAKKGALVRRAVSVENIGRVTHICTDKTGTITRGELDLTHVVGSDDILTAALYASNPDIGDPMDLAISREAHRLHISVDYSKVLKRHPFTEDRKKETAQLENRSYSKGSPETILKLSNLDSLHKKEWLEKISELAVQGHKVIAVASIQHDHNQNVNREIEENYNFLGILAFEDSPRKEVAGAIAYCKIAGIKVTMITGDHPATSKAIGLEIGLGNNVLNAEEDFYKIENGSLGFLKSLDVVARCTPLQKLKIVEKLKELGEVVAVTGDGVNDVPALKVANIGIAMGLRGSRSAKEVSSIILSDDNFNTIVSAIIEGKKIFSNLKLSFEYLLLIHIPLVLIAAILPFLGYPLVFTPMHIVILELIIHPTAILGFQSFSKVNEIQSGALINKKSFLKVILPSIVVSSFLIYLFSKLSTDSSIDIHYARNSIVALLIIWSAFLVIILNTFRNMMAYVLAILSCLVSLLIYFS